MTGELKQALGLQGGQYAYMDMGSARSIVGSAVPVTVLAIRLRPGVDPRAWIKENEGTFPRTSELKSWDELSGAYRAKVVALGAPLFGVEIAVAVAAFLGLMILGWTRRLLRFRPGNIARNLWLFAGAFSLTILVLFALLPVVQGLLAGNLARVYPLLDGTTPPWGWGWEVAVLPVWSFLMTLALSSWRWTRVGNPHRPSAA